ncbi:protein kinase domain-containing protein [Diaporthe helianthi]|uniref:Protein kinase domain-containing protein n=1 Tax=Diaporthe helianthi TaxID=158607 RepID=A0A2P5HYB2_DIAHE|nr:protein kinase domain-containing protein [Diaporthe helianthi]
MDQVMRFDTARIEKTVTRQFVHSHLLPDEIDRLDKPLAFGDGLTDCTYWEWIEGHAKRLFLILVDLGVPDQIFGVIDDSWEDVDLPIALDQVERLCLTATKDPKSERRFFDRQFHYLLRPLRKGEHIDYQDEELVPIDVYDRRPGLIQSNEIDRVGLPNVPGDVFCRRRFPTGHDQGCLSREDLLFEISTIRDLQNGHLVSYWASYTHQGFAYVLFTPVSEYKLSAYLTTTPQSIKNVDKTAKRRLVLDWVQCLVDTLCYVHSRGRWLAHIKPSTVLFTHDNRILLSGFSRLSPDAPSGQGGAFFDKGTYDYAAPERWPSKSAKSPTAPRIKAAAPSSSRSGAPSVRSGKSGHTDHSSSSSSSRSAPSAAAAAAAAPRPEPAPAPRLDPQAADIFSMGCVILELLSHGLFKRSAGAFASYRSAKHKNAGRGGAVLDSSFHKNLGQVEGWMTALAKEASKKAEGSGDKGQLFGGVTPLLQLVSSMLSPHPPDRPSAFDVQRRTYQILTQECGITEPHCVHQYDAWDHLGVAVGEGPGGAGTASTGRNSIMTTIDEASTPEEGLATAEMTAATTITCSSNQSSFDEHEDDVYGDEVGYGGGHGGGRVPSKLGARGGGDMPVIVGQRDHSRQTSQDSSWSKESGHDHSQAEGQRWELNSGLKAIQNLRINRSRV